MEGIINYVEDHGTIVTVWVQPVEAAEFPVHFDHRSFESFAEDNGYNLMGLNVRFADSILEVLS